MSASSISSGNEAESPSYFTAAHRRTISDSESPSISPYTYPASAPAQSNRRLRPPIYPHSRARSDELSGYSRFTVQTIDENEPSQNNAPLLVDLETLRPPQDTNARTSAVPCDDGSSQVPPSAATSRRSSSKASVKSFIGRFLPRPNRVSKPYTSTPVIPLAEQNAGHKRARSESDAGRSKAKLSTILQSQKTRSAENIARNRFRESSEFSRPTSLTPLRPPVSRNVSDNSRGGQRQIKMETPFTQLEPKDPFDEVPHREPPTSRRSSSRPKIVAAPLNIFRKFRRLSKTATEYSPRSRSASPSTSNTHGHDMRGHVSQLRRTHTREVLRQVSRALRSVAEVLPGTRTLTRMKTFPNDSTPSKKPRGNPQGVPLVPPLRMTTQKSMEIELDHSASSSMRNLRLGPPPNATPEEQATYKLKKSPSAETENFLKVDISLHGGTSYLPSEARRIHTPPLPGENAEGKRRGFFFDHNAPAGTPDTTVHPSFTPGSKRRPVEWYDTKLVKMDTASDEGTPEESKVSPNFIAMRERTARALHEMRIRNAKTRRDEEDATDLAGEGKDEDEIDYRIAEHYTNSPLCPANARYWRFVDGKMGTGRYVRTCWMHGELQH